MIVGSGLAGSILPAAARVGVTTDVSLLTIDAGEQIDGLLQESSNLEGSETKLALEKAEAALAAARRASLKPRELRSLLQLGRVKRLLNDLPGAMTCAHDGLDLAATSGDERMRGEFFLLRGLVEWNQAKVPEATVSMMECFRLGELLGDKGLQIGSLYGRGIVRGRGDDPDGALECLLPALQLAEEIGDYRLGQISNGVGVIYLQKKDYPQARFYFERALQALQGGSNLRTTAYIQLNLGQIASETGDQETAGKFLDSALALCERYEFRRGRADIYYLQGARQRRLGNPAEAVRQLDLALELAEKLNHPDLFIEIYNEYIQTEQSRGGYRAALDYTRKLAAKLEEVRGEKTRRQAVEIQARYEAEHHARQVKMLQRVRDIQQADLALQASELRHAQIVYVLLIVTIVLGGITWAALASRQRAKARLANRMLAETSAAKLMVEAEDARKGELLTVAARDLRESEQRFRSAFEHSPLGFTLVALNGRWMRVNPALCKIVGYTEAELLATTFQALTHPEDLDGDLQLLARLLAGQVESYTLEKRYLHKQGHAVWVQIDVTLMRDQEDGRPAYFIGQVDDITERRRAREQLRAAKEVAEHANEAKNVFLSRMSHELRTPLNAILGFSQLLECSDLGERQSQSLGHISTAGRHLLDLINEVLDIAQIESGDFNVEMELASVEEAMRGAILLMEPAAQEAGLKIVPEFAGGNSLQIRADARRLQQVLLNLFSNAIKYTQAGGRITARVVTRNGRVRMEISDTGYGISTGDFEKIFAPFIRLASTESIKGAGLGLSVVKALTEVMGGKVSVESALGVGSTFALEFELASAADEMPEPFANLGALMAGFYEEPVKHDVTVLYIEDIPENVELVRYIFETMPGIRLVSAGTGKAGLDLAKAETPDLVLLDLNLPDMPGAAVLASLRREPALKEVPVIIMSADASMSQAETLRSLGAQEYLVHPFDLRYFRRLVEETVLVPKEA